MQRHYVVVTTSLTAGGAEKQAVAIANGLAEAHRVTLVTLFHADFLADRVKADVSYICLGANSARSFLQNPLELRKGIAKLKALGPDAVLSLNFPAQTLVWAAQLAGLRTRHVISERQENLGSRARTRLRRLMYHAAALITANTSATARAIAAAGLTNTDEVVVIPNIVEVTATRAVAVESPKFRWICIARLDEQKDVATLLRACSRLRDAGRNFELTVVGGGVNAQDLADQIRSSNLDRNVTLLGQRSDAMELLAQSAGLVLSSRWEGMPNVVLEAGARGVPVVATDVGGVREAVPTEMWEFLVPPGDDRALADSMIRMMELSLSERTRLGELMAEHIERHFCEAQIIAKWDRILAGRP